MTTTSREVLVGLLDDYIDELSSRRRNPGFKTSEDMRYEALIWTAMGAPRVAKALRKRAQEYEAQEYETKSTRYQMALAKAGLL